ncbi:PAQR family membrane homeostasis protein TrhA [Flavobacterium sp. N3904]|uniref:PAQR family membrane homeostasis protein TrhA n=1 Tax=Flavobacterium sp. N3904 TaxID=2986835 RepID=UPI002224DFAE|nr:hemolysin III family protein [Flavobacterium sp. N3904]
MDKRIQTRKEELANGITHIMGILFCLIGMPFVIAIAFQKHDLITLFSVFTFGIGMLLVYTFSTFYHLVRNEKAKRILNIADHISIYYLIAGTYTPLMMLYLKRDTALLFLGIMWFVVLLGTIFKVFYTRRFEFVSVFLYLIMGWMIIFVIKPLWNTIPLTVFLWILAGGICYTLGVYFYIKGDKQYFHTIWHFFVLLGTIFHFIAVFISL